MIATSNGYSNLTPLFPNYKLKVITDDFEKTFKTGAEIKMEEQKAANRESNGSLTKAEIKMAKKEQL